MRRLGPQLASWQPRLEPLSTAGGVVLADVRGGLQLHKLSDVELDAVRGVFSASGAGVLLARKQAPADEAGLRRAAKSIAMGPFVETAHGPVQRYLTRGRRGTAAAQKPRGSDFWHQDNSYLPMPSRYTALYATSEIPEDEGDTDFANLQKAWESWPEAETPRDAIRSLRAVHCHAHNAGLSHPDHAQGAALPEQVHRLVRRHPVTGKEAFFLSPCYVKRIEGVAPDMSKTICDRLLRHATSSQYLFSHRWQPGDLLFWDNHIVMHRANTIKMSPKCTRLMFRMSFGD